MITIIFQYIYLILIGSFLFGLVYQTYLAGLAAVARTSTWSSHGEAGFLLLFAGLVQLIMIFPARLPKPARWMSAGLFLVMVLQLLVIFDRDSSISALHPVLALVLFLMAWRLTGMALQTLRGPKSQDVPVEGHDA